MKHPTREECERLLDQYGTPEHVKGHCREVARTAPVSYTHLDVYKRQATDSLIRWLK